MESTGVLWVSPYQSLEDKGFSSKQLALINARDFKAVAGRKTDKKDAQSLAEYGRIGMIRPSFVPPRRFREMRMVAHLYTKLDKELQRNKSRYLKLLNFVGCRASNAFSDINGKAAKAIVKDFIAQGSASLTEIIEKYGARLRQSPEKIADVLNFEVSPSMRSQLCLLRKYLDQLEALKSEHLQLLQQMQQEDQSYIDALMKIPGVKEKSARLIFAEVTNDLSSFPDSEHFASWAGVCPGNCESAGKRQRKGCQEEQAFARSLSRMWPSNWSYEERRGHNRAVVAIAHRFVLIIYALFAKGKSYEDKPTEALEKVRVARFVNSVRNIKKLNYVILKDGKELVNKETDVITTVPL